MPLITPEIQIPLYNAMTLEYIMHQCPLDPRISGVPMCQAIESKQSNKPDCPFFFHLTGGSASLLLVVVFITHLSYMRTRRLTVNLRDKIGPFSLETGGIIFVEGSSPMTVIPCNSSTHACRVEASFLSYFLSSPWSCR